MTSKGKPEKKRHKRPGHRWKSNTKIVVKKI
jgi:ribosomal protein L21